MGVTSGSRNRCETPLLGGSQKVSMVIGAQTSEASATFSYQRPEVHVVFPPELSAGTSSPVSPALFFVSLSVEGDLGESMQ